MSLSTARPCGCSGRRGPAPAATPRVVDLRHTDSGPRMLAGSGGILGLGFDWGDVGRIITDGAGYVIDYGPAVVDAGSAAYNAYTSRQRLEIDRKAQLILARFKAIGVVLSQEEAIALAQEPDDRVEAVYQAARANMTANAELSAQIGTGGVSLQSSLQPPPQTPQGTSIDPKLLLAGGVALVAIVVVASKK